MARNEAKTYVVVEELKKKHQVSDAIFEGVKAAKNWKSGKQVEESEFVKACEDFKTSTADGRNTEVKG